MIIKSVQKLTLIDFPKVIACSVFLFGCNFRCPYCQNPELIIGPKEPSVSLEEFFNFLKRRTGLIEGVCITGGEPTINRDLPLFIIKVKELGFKVKLDTNGSNPSMLEDLIERGLLDYVAMDVKAPPYKYDVLAGVKVDEKKIKESVEVVKSSNIDYEFRITIPPGFFTVRDIIEMGKWLKGSKKLYVQEFNSEKTLDERLRGRRSDKNELLKYRDVLRRFVECCEIRLVS